MNFVVFGSGWGPAIVNSREEFDIIRFLDPDFICDDCRAFIGGTVNEEGAFLYQDGRLYIPNDSGKEIGLQINNTKMKLLPRNGQLSLIRLFFIIVV